MTTSQNYLGERPSLVIHKKNQFEKKLPIVNSYFQNTLDIILHLCLLWYCRFGSILVPPLNFPLPAFGVLPLVSGSN